jgi:predicted transcriptional regulator
MIRLIQPKATIPHAVVGLVVRQGCSLPRAWRDHFGLTQTEVAGRMGITQAALSQLEVPGRKLRKQTVIALAAALNVQPDQLSE